MKALFVWFPDFEDFVFGWEGRRECRAEFGQRGEGEGLVVILRYTDNFGEPFVFDKLAGREERRGEERVGRVGGDEMVCDVGVWEGHEMNT